MEGLDYETYKIKHKSYKLDFNNAEFNPNYFYYYGNKNHILERVLKINYDLYHQDNDKLIGLLSIFNRAEASILCTIIYYQLLNKVEKISFDDNVLKFLKLLNCFDVYQLDKIIIDNYEEKINLLIKRLKNVSPDIIPYIEKTKALVQLDDKFMVYAENITI